MIGTVLLALRLLLAAIFTTAGAGKVLDPAGSRRALADFGVPGRLTTVGAVALPLVEITIAVSLAIKPSAQWGAAAAVALLLSFVAGIATALRQGRAPDCHCFGQIHSAPAGRGTLIRNGVLALLAALVAWRGPGPSIGAWVAARSGNELLLSGLFLIGAALLALGLRAWWKPRADERAKARERQPAGLPAGAPAPDFSLPDLDGEPRELARLQARGLPVVLVFVHPSCGPCANLLPDLRRWQVALAERLAIVVLSQGDIQENRVTYEEHGLVDVLVQRSWEVFEAYAMAATPAAVVVAPDGRIASATARGQFLIEELIRLTLRRTAPPQRVAALTA